MPSPGFSPSTREDWRGERVGIIRSPWTGILSLWRRQAAREDSMFNPASVRFRGPLRAHVDGFWAELQSQGYAPLSGRNLLLVTAHFSRWLDDHRLELGDLTEERVALFLAHRRRRGYTQFLSPRALGPLLGYLCGIGIV